MQTLISNVICLRLSLFWIKPLCISNIIDGLQKIQATVIYCNETIPKSTSDICSIHNRAITILANIYLYGELSAQRVLNVLLLGQIIKSTSLLSYASINEGTGTFNKLKTNYQIPPNKMNKLITIVSIKYSVDAITAENIICESFRKTKVFDFQLPGQCLYDVIEGKSKDLINKYTVHKILLDGTGTPSNPTITSPVQISGSRFMYWWFPKQESLKKFNYTINDLYYKPNANVNYFSIRHLRPRGMQKHKPNVVLCKEVPCKLLRLRRNKHNRQSKYKERVAYISRLIALRNKQQYIKIDINVMKKMCFDNNKNKPTYNCIGDMKTGFCTTITVGSQLYHVDGSQEEVITFYNKFDMFTPTDDGPGRFRFAKKKTADVFCVVNYFYNNIPKAKTVQEKRLQFIQKNNINIREYTTLVDAVTKRKMFCIWRKKKGCYMIQYVGIFRLNNNDWKPFCHIKNE
jgi:hypothetical protein